jgi:mannose-6-phosphate isomerase-like protein (cupin superfamily)
MAARGVKKPWGSTVPLLESSAHRYERIIVNQGGFSSVHYHAEQYNWFQMQTGSIGVYWFGETPYDSAPPERHYQILRAGEHLIIPPGIWHQFVVLESGVGHEFYWTGGSLCRAEDIIRATENGESGYEEPTWQTILDWQNKSSS